MGDTDKWGKDGPPRGCLASVGKLGAGAVILVAAAVVSYQFLAPALVNLWW